MKDFTSERMRGIEKTLIRRINDLKSPSSIDLGMGELKFPTPQSLLERVKEHAAEWNLGYTPNEGLAELRELIAASSGLGVSPDQVCVTVGSEEAIFGLLMVIVSPGDEILVPDPGYPVYASIVKLAGGEPAAYPLFAEHGFGLHAEEIEKRLTPRTKAVIINSPNNPTGAVYAGEELKRLAAILDERQVLAISDEVYGEIAYEGRPDSIARYSSHFAVINSLSKTFSMTGWRLGWCIGPADLIRVFARFHQLAVTCAPAISQHAAIFALRGAADAEKRLYLEELGRRRALAMRCFKESTDLTCFAPAGAFYIFIDISSKAARRGPSLDAALSLLAEEKVVAIPGSAFGARGEGYLRISFAAEPEKIEEGIRRIGRFFG